MVPKGGPKDDQSKAEAPRKRRVFSEEFKQDAVRLVVYEDHSFAAPFCQQPTGISVRS